MEDYRKEELLSVNIEDMTSGEREDYKLALYDYLGELEEMDLDENSDDFDEWLDLCDEVRDIIEYVEQF